MWIYLPKLTSVSSAEPGASTSPSDSLYRRLAASAMWRSSFRQPQFWGRRRLNTKFVAWLMGLPEGWTSPAPINSEDLGIWLSHSREHLRSLFSSIETPKGNK
jgi:hypothetical protein